MANKQDADELRVFRRFVESARLAVSPESIQKRQPPEPDIQCKLGDHGCTCFELVEIVDSDLARAVGNQLTFQQRLSGAAGNHGLRGLSDGLIFVRFVHAGTVAQRTGAIPRLMELLQELPAGFRGDIPLPDDAALNEVVQKLRVTRGEFVGPSFQVDGATFISDPVIERIEGKFSKEYATANRLELLAFYELHPTLRAEYQLPAVEEFVRNNLQSSQFSRVWVFDAENSAVLYSF
jgi:hypothetical protein